MLRNFNLVNLLYMVPSIVLAFTIHEFAHAWIGVRAGDDTPRLMGRYTLNPLRHISWPGLALIIIAGFGWAKPVLINREKLRNRRTDSILISLAGPLANLIAAFFFCLVLKVVYLLNTPINPGFSIHVLLYYLIYVNAVLFIFNMLPIPPLDGSHILADLLPESLAVFKQYYLRYGSYLFMVLVLMDVAGINVFGNIMGKTFKGITRIFGLQ